MTHPTNTDILTDEEVMMLCLEKSETPKTLTWLVRAAERAIIEKLGASDAVPVAWIRKNGFRFNADAEPQDDSEAPLYDATALARVRQQGRNEGLEQAAMRCQDIYSWSGAHSAGPLSESTLDACAAAIRAIAARQPTQKET